MASPHLSMYKKCITDRPQTPPTLTQLSYTLMMQSLDLFLDSELRISFIQIN